MGLETVKENLEKRGFAVSVFATAKEAVEYLDGAIDGTTVGMGGSMTIEEMGLFERLKTHNEVIWHQHRPEGMDPRECLLKENASKVYIASMNGATEDGELINIDGRGNRVAAISYGPEKVYLVLGRNKIAPDFDSALQRARNEAAPKNAQRLSCKTPCAKDAKQCFDCASPGRICRILQVLWIAPMGADYEVVLIDEDLGY